MSKYVNTCVGEGKNKQVKPVKHMHVAHESNPVKTHENLKKTRSQARNMKNQFHMFVCLISQQFSNVQVGPSWHSKGKDAKNPQYKESTKKYVSPS